MFAFNFVISYFHELNLRFGETILDASGFVKYLPTRQVRLSLLNIVPIGHPFIHFSVYTTKNIFPSQATQISWPVFTER